MQSNIFWIGRVIFFISKTKLNFKITIIDDGSELTWEMKSSIVERTLKFNQWKEYHKIPLKELKNYLLSPVKDIPKIGFTELEIFFIEDRRILDTKKILLLAQLISNTQLVKMLFDIDRYNSMERKKKEKLP